MIEFLAIAAIIVWFVYWGWIMATRPDTAFRFNEMGRQNLNNAARGFGKAAVFGFKLWRR